MGAAGLWPLVDHFEKDGRRYLIARQNDPFVPGDKLTLRERQVVGFVALDHANKLIGYELGLGSRLGLIKAFTERVL